MGLSPSHRCGRGQEGRGREVTRASSALAVSPPPPRATPARWASAHPRAQDALTLPCPSLDGPSRESPEPDPPRGHVGADDAGDCGPHRVHQSTPTGGGRRGGIGEDVSSERTREAKTRESRRELGLWEKRPPGADSPPSLSRRWCWPDCPSSETDRKGRATPGSISPEQTGSWGRAGGAWHACPSEQEGRHSPQWPVSLPPRRSGKAGSAWLSPA